MVSAKLPKLQRLKSAQSPWDFPALPSLQSEESYIEFTTLCTATQWSALRLDSGKFGGALGREMFCPQEQLCTKAGRGLSPKEKQCQFMSLFYHSVA